MAAATETKMSMIKLESNDKEMYHVSQKVANMSTTIKTLLDDLGNNDDPKPNDDSDIIPLAHVSGPILKMVIKWSEQHKDDVVKEVAEDDEKDKNYLNEIPAWDADFLKVDQSTLFELIVAANYLDIKGLLDITCQVVANMIKGKTCEEIRKVFEIENDFTKEEEEQIRKENEWAEEK